MPPAPATRRVTARPDRPAEPLARKPDTQDAGADFAALSAQERRPPPGDTSDDGRTGGQVQDGEPGHGNFAAASGGVNAQSGRAAGVESERDAPGASTDKKADDLR